MAPERRTVVGDSTHRREIAYRGTVGSSVPISGGKYRNHRSHNHSPNSNQQVSSPVFNPFPSSHFISEIGKSNSNTSSSTSHSLVSRNIPSTNPFRTNISNGSFTCSNNSTASRESSPADLPSPARKSRVVYPQPTRFGHTRKVGNSITGSWQGLFTGKMNNTSTSRDTKNATSTGSRNGTLNTTVGSNSSSTGGSPPSKSSLSSPRKVTNPPLTTCQICFELSCESGEEGLSCSLGHFICSADLNGYCEANVFPRLFQLREQSCRVICPVPQCGGVFPTAELSALISDRARRRYQGLLRDLLGPISPAVLRLADVMREAVTLACPSCQIAVDPTPDACSAVMCLNCSAYYCNYCFAAFTSAGNAVIGGGDSLRSRAEAHEHVATHQPLTCTTEARDAFLPPDIVRRGQRNFQFQRLVKCLVLAMRANEFSVDPKHFVACALILCYEDITLLEIDPLNVWKAARQEIETAFAASFVSSSAMEVTDTSSMDVVIENCNGRDNLCSTTSSHESPSPQRRRFTHVAVGSPDESRLTVDSPSHAHAHSYSSLNVGEEFSDGGGYSPPGSNSVDMEISSPLSITSSNIHLGSVSRTSSTDILTVPGSGYSASVTATGPTSINGGSSAMTTMGFPIMAASSLELGPDWNALRVSSPLQAPFSAPTTTDTLSPTSTLASSTSSHSALSSSITATLCPSPPVNRSGALLANAILENNIPAIHQILSSFGSSIDVNYIARSENHDLDVRTILYPLTSLAILLNMEWLAVHLIRHGADVLAVDSFKQRSVFYIAVEHGCTQVLDAILSRHPRFDLDQPLTREEVAYTALHIAARFNQGHLVERLICAGATVTTYEKKDGYCPLGLAIALGNSWTALELIRFNACVNKLSEMSISPFFIAVEKGQLATVQAILRQHPLILNDPIDLLGTRPLHLAVKFRHTHLVRFLLSQGANQDVLDADGLSPLMLAVQYSDMHSALVLLEAGAALRNCTVDRRYCIHLVVERGHDYLLERMLTLHPSHVNLPCGAEEEAHLCPLHVAIQFNQLTSMAILLRHGADVNKKETQHGLTPIMLAAVCDNSSAMQVLLEARPDIQLANLYGRRLLFILAERGLVDIFPLIVSTYGLDVNQYMTEGRMVNTVLHVACMFNQPAMVQLLLDMNADHRLLDAQGKTPQALAEELNSFAALQVLQHHHRAKLPPPVLETTVTAKITTTGPLSAAVTSTTGTVVTPPPTGPAPAVTAPLTITAPSGGGNTDTDPGTGGTSMSSNSGVAPL